MKWFGIGTAVLTLAVAGSSGAAYGQDDARAQSGNQRATPQQRPAETPQASHADTQGFIHDMTIVGLAEVQLGNLAAERAANADVKAFGQMMVKDHTQANNELKQIATKLAVQPPTELDQKHKELADKLSKLRGADFDREYMSAMMLGHQEVLGRLRARADTALPAHGAAAGEHPAAPHPGAGNGEGGAHGEQAITQWAAKALPTVQKHLDRAREVQQTLAK